MLQDARLMNRISPYMSDIIERVPQLVSRFKKQYGKVDYLFDLNEVICQSTESLFTFANDWTHCNARGNALCAQYVAQVLRQKEWL